MKRGDLVEVNIVGGYSVECYCLSINGGYCYLGTDDAVILHGVYFELLNKGSITAKLKQTEG